MSLVKFDSQQVQQDPSNWSKRDKHATRHKLPSDVASPVLDYDKLRALCTIEGLKNRHQDESTQSAHQQFMHGYRSVFVEPKTGTTIPQHVLKYREHRASLASVNTTTADSKGNSKSVVAAESSLAHKPGTKPQTPEPEPSHDVRDYLPLIHKHRRSEEPSVIKTQRIKTLRKLLRKLPFERSAAENEQIYKAVKHFSVVAGQVSALVLKELCVVAQLDAWKDEDITVFGNTGLHFVLRGTVRPYGHPYMKHRGVKVDFPARTPEPPYDMPSLEVGDCFGTLEKVEGRDPNSRVLTVTTLEPNCEFLKVSTSDYQRVIEQIHNRDQTEKTNLMQSCSTYRLWSKQPLNKVAQFISWMSFPPNTVLVSEGYEAPFIAIIKSGECHVLRQVDVMHQLPGGRREKRTKQVVMGKLGPSTSFGEVSIIGEEPMTCSIVTATNVQLASIEPKQLDTLDDVTLQLLLQSSERTYAHLTQDDIHTEYIQQELKREWNQFKHNAVVEAINAKGVRPGYGKWAKD